MKPIKTKEEYLQAWDDYDIKLRNKMIQDYNTMSYNEFISKYRGQDTQLMYKSNDEIHNYNVLLFDDLQIVQYTFAVLRSKEHFNLEAKMTVEELISALMDMPKNAKVIVVEPSLRGANIKNVAINDDELGKGKVKIYIT